MVEPVPGLGDRDGVERRGRERHRLRGARNERHLGQHPAQRGAHPGYGLDGDERRARGFEQAGELARTGRQVGDAALRSDAQVPDEPGHGFGRVRRARRLVVGRVVETRRGDVVNHDAIVPLGKPG